MADVEDAVSAHYTRGDLGERILDGLRRSGANMERLRPGDVAGVDQFHIGGRAATLALAELAGVQPGWQVLDVGGGIGGAARTLASDMRCQVTVVDATAELVEVGAMLCQRMDLAGMVRFRHASALDLPFTDQKFDVVWTQHSSMNIADKERLYREAHRVLRPKGRLAIHEIVAGPVRPIRYPAPWSSDGAASFLLPQSELRQAIAGAGFRELAWQDTTRASLEWFRRVAPPFPVNGNLPALGMHLLLGERAADALWGQVRNLEEQRIEVIQAAFERK